MFKGTRNGEFVAKYVFIMRATYCCYVVSLLTLYDRYFLVWALGFKTVCIVFVTQKRRPIWETLLSRLVCHFISLISVDRGDFLLL